MGNLAIKEPPEFQQEIHQVEEEEYLTAELENEIKGALLNNDVYLKQKLEEILKQINEKYAAISGVVISIKNLINENKITLNSSEDCDLSICKEGDVYEKLLYIDKNGMVHVAHAINILDGDLNLDATNLQHINFVNFSIGQNGSDDGLAVKNINELLIEYDSNLESFINYKKNVIKNDIQFFGRDANYENYGYQIFQDLDSLVLQGNNDDLSNLDWRTIMRLCYESSEMYLDGISTIFLPTTATLYFGNSSIEGTYFTIEEKRLESMYMHTFSLMAVGYRSISKHEIRGILFNFVNNQPIWQVIQEQHSAQSAWFLDFNFYDSNHTNKKRIAYFGESEVHFEVPVTASNITKTANELKLAQQEITEQDLQLIETQQLLTEQELETIETQQLLTEMDLERLEGGQAL